MSSWVKTTHKEEKAMLHIFAYFCKKPRKNPVRNKMLITTL